MLSNIQVEHIKPEKWRDPVLWKLLVEYKSANGNVTVPEGFITDGASVPRILTPIFPRTGRYFGAAIVHDYIIVEEDNWKKANKEFDEELRALDIEWWRRFLILNSVKIYGKLKKLFKFKDLYDYPHK
jgi:hypothetical protein